ncbi:S-adenosyl-L-methionine-dependent methyltransferase [Athelia psychrophila]|uniref:S-adenosyl-L-methionine-dependent methyltransferase n=1 Tax=Athelia psychrophila TaxID=1759441 RepID=A0A166W663_9AGAM|nr:S-adenosyl-L-methionine-dependent methyltransferase [Fibularhizoctonia sp. CBS 109695]
MQNDNIGIQHNARTHVSRNYALPADDVERVRLDVQHGILKAAFGNRLILAPVTVKPGDCVLDSGTGTGAWPLDFAKEAPSTVSIYGVDISSRLFPSDPPANVKFLTCSITRLPETWTSTFTLVNQKLLLHGLSAAAWQGAFSEMYRILVPGGWVNLCELHSLSDLDRLDFEVGPAAKKMLTLVGKIVRSGGALLDAALHLPGWLEQAGFTDVRTEMSRVPLSGDEGRPMRDNVYNAYLAMKTPALKAGGFGLVKSEEEYDEAVHAMREELVGTDNAAIQTYVIYAQKPVNA